MNYSFIFVSSLINQINFNINIYIHVMRTKKITIAKKNDTTKSNAFSKINEMVLEGLKKEGLKWFKPWRMANGDIYAPVNYVTGRPYNGINTQILSAAARAKGYTSGEWGTFKNISDNGGQVRKGEKATAVALWTLSYKEDETGKYLTKKQALDKGYILPMDVINGKLSEMWGLKYYLVFNIDQCDNIETKISPIAPQDVEPIPTAEDIYNSFKNKPSLKHGGNEAYYSPAQDHVQMPSIYNFVDADSYYKTLFHELIHSTGHQNRLNRVGVAQGVNKWGDETYSKEELVAEIGAWYLVGLCDLDPKDSEFNSQAYINGWCKKLEEKEKEVVYAMTQAQKAVNHILGNGGTDTPQKPKAVKKQAVLRSKNVSLVNHSEIFTPHVDGQIGANVGFLVSNLKAKFGTEMICEMVFNNQKEVDEAKIYEVIKLDGVYYNIYLTHFQGETAIGYAPENKYRFELIAEGLDGTKRNFKFGLSSVLKQAPIQRAYMHAIQVCHKNFWEFKEVRPYNPKLNSKQVTIDSEPLEITSIRYFETARGLGYECQTNKMNVRIWNDGQGGETYMPPYFPFTKKYMNMNENELEALIDDFEGVKREKKNMYPKTMTARYFKHDSDTRNPRNEMYASETEVNNRLEESKFFEGLNHEANIVIEIKLSNGVII